MKRVTSGVVVLGVLFGVTACATDWSMDFGGPPSMVQANPSEIFIDHGAEKAVLVRLINDRNQGIPASFSVSDVGAGISVRHDDTYRPDFIGSDTLKFDPIQEQHRYWVKGDAPNGAQSSFKVSNGSLSTTVTVRVLPANVGALPTSSAALGEALTINAPASLSFTDATTIVFDTVGGVAGTATTGNAFITQRSAKSITFLPRPGTTGQATVSALTLDYAPTLAPRSLKTTNRLEVPPVTSIPVSFSAMTPGTPVTASAAGFKFYPNTEILVGGKAVFIVSVAADSNTASVVLPYSASGDMLVNNAALASLPMFGVVGMAGTGPAVNTPTTPWDGSVGNDDAPVITAAAAGTVVDFYDTWINFFNTPGTPDVAAVGAGSSVKYYKLVIPSAGQRSITVNWVGAATNGDFDVFLATAPATAAATRLAAAASTANPEVINYNFSAAGTYWLVLGNYQHRDVTQIRVRVQ